MEISKEIAIEIVRAYKTELDPTVEQRRLLVKRVGAARGSHKIVRLLPATREARETRRATLKAVPRELSPHELAQREGAILIGHSMLVRRRRAHDALWPDAARGLPQPCIIAGVITASTTPSISAEDAAALRDRMVDGLQERVFRDERIEAAFRAVPRHLFLPEVDIQKVYGGDAIPTRFNEEKTPISSSSEVAVMAVMAEQLELVEGMRVLEIGAGTGYNAAVLSELVGSSGHITTVDIDPEISSEAQAHLAAAGYERVRVVTGDGWEGVSAGAPYDRIESTASTSDLSPAWVEQLVEGGILLVPLWIRAGWQALVAFRKRGDALSSASVRGGGFMPLRGMGAPVDPGVRRDDWRVIGAREEDLDAIFELLRSDPRLVLGPAYDPQVWERMTALAAFGPDLIGLTSTGRGFGLGLYDADATGFAVATFSSLAYLGPRIVYALYGDDRPLPRLRTLVEEGPKSCAEVVIEAQPLASPVIEGGLPRRHFRPVVTRSS